MNDAWKALFEAKREYDQAFAIGPDGWLTVEQRRTNALVKDAMTAVEAAIRSPLQGRLQEYETALERVNVLISAVPPSFRIDSDHPAAVTIRAIDLCLRELSSQEGF